MSALSTSPSPSNSKKFFASSRVFGVMVLQRISPESLYFLYGKRNHSYPWRPSDILQLTIVCNWGRSTRVDNNGVRLCYDVEGSGPVAVLPHVGAFLTGTKAQVTTLKFRD